MKTAIKFKISLVSIAIASVSISSYASGDINVSPMKESSLARVEIDVPALDDVKVSVLDPGGIVIHNDLISKNSEYEKLFNFSQVEDGVYTVVTKTGYTTVAKTIELDNNNLSVINKEFSYEPIFKIDGDILTVNYLNRSNQDISIYLLDSAKDYYKEEGDNSISYGKMLNIKKLPLGEYKVVLAVGEKEYNYNFKR